MSERRTFKLGDMVSSLDFGIGNIVAMSLQWCIFKSGKDEFALPWEDVELYQEAIPPNSPESEIDAVEVK